MPERVVILCGGRGTRLQADVPGIPKPLVEIGGRPILWHVIQIYAAQGLTRLRAAHGLPRRADRGVRRARRRGPTGVTVRVRRHRPRHADRRAHPRACGDRVGDGDVPGDVRRRRGRRRPAPRCAPSTREHGALATMTVVRPELQFGVARLDGDDRVLGFHEKPRVGALDQRRLLRLRARRARLPGRRRACSSASRSRASPTTAQLRAYRHTGFWDCMDTYKDAVLLNDLWAGGATRPGRCGPEGRGHRRDRASSAATSSRRSGAATVVEVPRGSCRARGTPTSSSTSRRRRSSPRRTRDPVATFEANVALAWRMLAAARAPRAVVVSTDQVYGADAAACPTPEDAPLRPDGPYAASKAAADLLARRRCRASSSRGWSTSTGPATGTTSRLVPGHDRGGARRARAGDPRRRHAPRATSLYVDDAVAALLALAERGERGGGLQRRHRRARTPCCEVVDAVLRVAGSDLEPEVARRRRRPARAAAARSTSRRSRAATGWAPRDRRSRRACAGRWRRRVADERRDRRRRRRRTRGRCACAGCSTRSRSRRSTRERFEVVVVHDDAGYGDRPLVAAHPLGARDAARSPAARAGRRKRNAGWRATRGAARRVHRRRLPPARRVARAGARRRRARPARSSRARRGPTPTRRRCCARRTRARCAIDPPTAAGADVQHRLPARRCSSALGGFDETACRDRAGEDTDLALRAREAGVPRRRRARGRHLPLRRDASACARRAAFTWRWRQLAGARAPPPGAAPRR